jgi:hypothetical protein
LAVSCGASYGSLSSHRSLRAVFTNTTAAASSSTPTATGQRTDSAMAMANWTCATTTKTTVSPTTDHGAEFPSRLRLAAPVAPIGVTSTDVDSDIGD